MMQQNGQNSHHLRENESAKHVEQSQISRMNAHHASHLKRNAEIVAGEDFLNHHTLAAILEKGPEVSNDHFCSSRMSMMCQAQDHQPDGRLINNAYQIDSIRGNPLDSLEGRVDTISPTTSKNGLIRHGSSPVGLPSLLAVNVQSLSENGYPVGPMRDIMGMTKVTVEDASCGGIARNRLSSQTSFLRQSSSPAGLMSQLPLDMDLREIAEKPNMPMMGSTAENRARNNSDDDNLANGIGDHRYSSNFFAGSWEDASMLPANCPGMQTGISFVARKHGREFNEKIMPDLSLPESQKRDPRNHGASALINDLFGLPKSTIPEVSVMDLIQDSVPCKIRAKRGFATHPRSIAERVRRTRISERMRKLQQLVPNMEKQTNTADMLDEAVEYIKFLQKQVHELSMNRSECNGSCKCNSDPTAKV